MSFFTRRWAGLFSSCLHVVSNGLLAEVCGARWGLAPSRASRPSATWSHPSPSRPPCPSRKGKGYKKKKKSLSRHLKPRALHATCDAGAIFFFSCGIYWSTRVGEGGLASHCFCVFGLVAPRQKMPWTDISEHTDVLTCRLRNCRCLFPLRSPWRPRRRRPRHSAGT